MVEPGSLASRGTRLLAATYDDLILLGISLPLLFQAVSRVAAVAAAQMEKGADLGAMDLQSLPDTGTLLHAMLWGPGTLITLVALLLWCVITGWLVATNGQSIGKRLVGIKVVRTDGSRASFARIFLLRNVVNFLPNLLPYIGLLYQPIIDPLFIFQESQRCLHDMIADTMVVRCASTTQNDRNH
ncbi:MAG: RDD family protein [Proteobacteria bacterium]|nr:RDD family protein [Pseudomonadota bacterium]